MTDSAIAARLVTALETAADREAGAKTALVSVAIDMPARADAGTIETRLSRKTRTLVFMNAEYRSETGTLIAAASSVHKLLVSSPAYGRGGFERSEKPEGA
jgi:hypothetical protein